jgi:vesicle coat complex subunit
VHNCYTRYLQEVPEVNAGEEKSSISRKYEMILKDLCDNLKSLDDPDAKASMIWIIGEYVDTIENADELLNSFYEKS